MGRTGEWFAHEPSGVTPDVVTLAKGLGGGIPIGACVAIGEAGELLQPGNHGTTFGGNPVATAAALAVIETIEKDDLLANARTVGAHLAEGLVRDPRVTEVRHRGLLLGIDLSEERAVEAVSVLRRATIAPVDESLALEAVDLSLAHGLAMADSLVYATARRFGATLVTGDTDFTGLPDTVVVR